MLKYKLNIKNKEDKLIEVKYESLFLAKDGSYLTGITDPSYCLTEEYEIIVVSDETHTCNLSATNVMACGYVLFNEIYEVQDFGDTMGILYNDGQYYCINKDFQFFERNVRSETVLSTLDKEIVTPKITINGKEYEIGTINEEGEIEPYSNIVVPTKYWSFDNKITIHDITYDVIIDAKLTLSNDDNFFPYIILNDLTLSDEERILYVIDWEYSKRHLVTKFVIKSNFSSHLMVREAQCVKQFEFFDEVSENGVIKRKYITDDDYKTPNDFFHDAYIKGATIFNEWKKTDSNNVIDLYVNNNTYNILSNSQIFVQPTFSSLRLIGERKNDKNEIIFNYYGKRYVCDCLSYKQFLNINEKEYEICKTTNNKPYIVFNQTPLSIKIFEDNGQEKGKMILPSFYEQEENKSKFLVKTYYNIIIEGELYNIYETNNEGIYEIKLINNPPLCLKIISRFGNNLLRCIPFENEDLSGLFKEISLNPSNFVFDIKVPIFDLSLVSPIDMNEKKYISSDIKLLVNHSSFVIPVKLEADAALNLYKDDIISKQYLDDIKEDLINPTVDMEKDIYYPAFLEKKGNKDVLTLCHKIQIDLHFRSRNLNDKWSINDPNQIDEYGGLYPSNWNIFDKYRYQVDTDITKSLQPILNLKDDLQFYPPSDLLYFLNFTDEDVFYQKQKIGKSFLRIAFYDSPNPNKHNLLYSSTIFMSETELFQKYINSDKSLTHYINVKERGGIKEKHIYENDDYNHTQRQMEYIVDNDIYMNRISVSSEPCVNNKSFMATFDENKRLSSSFIIKNRNECIDSSDGFYLYLFKEYSKWTHERSIYMRVQFNHAGEGKTVNFMLLYHKDKNGNKSMINWSSKYNFDKYKEGCPLKELYEHIYIEIKVKYDLENKRFCYYLPEWMSSKNSDKNIMRLSLFEIKIKDES